MHTKSFLARSLWACICAGVWIISWFIAESIPVFNDILGLAVCGSPNSHIEVRRQRYVVDEGLTAFVCAELSVCQLVFRLLSLVFSGSG